MTEELRTHLISQVVEIIPMLEDRAREVKGGKGVDIPVKIDGVTDYLYFDRGEDRITTLKVHIAKGKCHQSHHSGSVYCDEYSIEDILIDK